MPRGYTGDWDRMNRRYYDEGYDDGYRDAKRERPTSRRSPARKRVPGRTKPRKLSAWQRFIKNKKNHIKMRNGKLNLKKMAVQYRKKKKR